MRMASERMTLPGRSNAWKRKRYSFLSVCGTPKIQGWEGELLPLWGEIGNESSCLGYGKDLSRYQAIAGLFVYCRYGTGTPIPAIQIDLRDYLRSSANDAAPAIDPMIFFNGRNYPEGKRLYDQY